jgi:hypothetical protein
MRPRKPGAGLIAAGYRHSDDLLEPVCHLVGLNQVLGHD